MKTVGFILIAIAFGSLVSSADTNIAISTLSSSQLPINVHFSEANSLALQIAPDRSEIYGIGLLGLMVLLGSIMENLHPSRFFKSVKEKTEQEK